MFVVVIIVILWICLGGLIHLIIRNKQINLSLRQIMFFYACKIAGGAVYGYVYKRYYNGDDTWGLNHDAFFQYQRLRQSPVAFIGDIFSSLPFKATDAYYFRPYGYLENLEFSLVTKTIALFDIFSQGNYYINLVFFNFLSFWGLYFLYKLIVVRHPGGNRYLIAAVLFLFPPAVFWLSGLRAEGFLILSTGMLLYHFNQWLTCHKIKNACLAALCIIINFILRDGFAAMLVPALLAWWLTGYFNTGTAKTFTKVYGAAIVVIAIGSFVLPSSFNVLAKIAARQQDFFALKGNTRFALAPLDGHPLSYLKVLPQALLNTFIRPFPWEAKGLLQVFASVENILILLLTGYTIFRCWRSGRNIISNPVVWALVLGGLFNYILTGYTVPFPGAVVRYKIIPEVLLISACLLCLPNGIQEKSYRTTASVQI